jgi:hypothetical protein
VIGCAASVSVRIAGGTCWGSPTDIATGARFDAGVTSARSWASRVKG